MARIYQVLGSVCLALGWVVMINLAGCSHTVNKAHPAVMDESTKDVAKIYFIRSDIRHSGATERPVQVLADDIPLVNLDKGTYALVYMNPGDKVISVKSHTQSGAEEKVVEVDETKLFHFKKGRSYYILLKAFYRGYRWGTSYRPKAIDHAVALRKAGPLHPTGDARHQPLRIQ